MKRIYSFMFAAVAAFTAASCAQELDNQVPAGETVTFEASVDGAETKAVLDGKVSKWEKGDKITIHNGTKGFEFATTDEGVKANFSYTGDDFSGDKFIAVYPAGKYTADVEAKTVKANIPTYQPSRDNSFSVGSVPSVAYTENQSLAFKNAAALLKFTVKGKNVKGLVFFGNNGEAVSGDVAVSLNEDNTVKSVVAQETTITENDQTETKLITWAKVWAQTDNWCFKEGTTYYLSVVPQKFEKGFSVNLEIDGVGEVKVKGLETAYDLKPNTILNLGELEYVAPVVDHSGWSLPGGYNSWNTANTFLYEDGDYYVAKNVKVMDKQSGQEAGFKFQHAEFGWKGVGATTALTSGQWHKLNGENNISLSAGNVAYDIYMTKDGSQFQAVTAGSPVPQAPPVVADYWGLIGSMTNWADDLVLAEEGDYLTVKGVAFKTTDEFKFRKNGQWNDQKIASATAKADIEYDLVDAGSNNMKIAVAGTYDVYVKKDLTKVYFMTVGKTPAEATKATTYKLYIKPTVSWSKYYLYAWGGYSTGGWPGKQLTLKENAPDDKGECYYVEIPNGTNIVNFIVNNNSGKQTKDLTKAKIKTLSTGDCFYELVQADLK